MVALLGLGTEGGFAQVPSRDLPGETIVVKGDAIVFVFPALAGQGTASDGSRPSPSEVALRDSLREVRATLLNSGIEVRGETSFKYAWGTQPKTKGGLFLSPRRDFLGTLFIQEGKRPSVHEGVETAWEILLRAEEYFGRRLPPLTSPSSQPRSP